MERALLNQVLEMREKTKCTKFVGALTVELLRKEFLTLGLNVSNRDVYIEGIPNEVDLLICKHGALPKENLLYSVSDIRAVLEVKFRGSYGKSAIDNIRNVFDTITSANRNIECLYLTVSENRRYKYRTTKENLGYECFELLTRDTNLESALDKGTLKTTGDWQRLLLKLKSLY
jgi:hypothetical protein